MKGHIGVPIFKEKKYMVGSSIIIIITFESSLPFNICYSLMIL